MMICGDDTGLCKSVSYDDGRVLARWGEQARGRAVRRLAHARGALACARADGTVELSTVPALTSAEPEVVRTYAAHGRSEPTGLAMHPSAERLVVADADGTVHVLSTDPGGGGGGGGESGGEAKRGSKRKPAAPAAPLASLSLGSHLAHLALSPAGDRLALCGRGTELSVWDFGAMAAGLPAAEGAHAPQQQPVWRARNVPEDETRLAVPVWHTAVAFVESAPACLVTTSGHVAQRLRGEVRLYDVRARARPVLRAVAPAGDVPLSALALSPEGHSAFVGTAKGELCRLDLRRDAALVGGYKGGGGAIVGLALQPERGLLLAVGYDRYARVYSVRSRALLHAVYLKQRQRALALVESGAGEIGADGEGGDARLDDDDDGVRGARAPRGGGGRGAPEIGRPPKRALHADDDADVEAILSRLERARDDGRAGGAHAARGAETSKPRAKEANGRARAEGAHGGVRRPKKLKA